MNVFFATMSRIWVRVAMMLARLRFSFVALILAIALCCVPGLFTRHSFIEGAILYLSERMSGIREHQAEVAFVSVDDALFDDWQEDVYTAESLSLLLANVLHSSDARVGILFDSPPRYQPDQLDALIYQSPVDLGLISQRVRQKLSLNEMLANSRVVMGHKEGKPAPRPVFRLAVEDFLERFARSFNLLSQPASVASPIPPLEAETSYRDLFYKLDMSETNTFNLWFDRDGALSPNYLAALCLAMNPENADEGTIRSFGILEARAQLPSCSRSGDIPVQPFVAAYEKLTSFRTRSVQLDLSEALALSTFPQWVFIAKKSDLDIHRQLATLIQSLKYDHILVQPWWVESVLRVVFLVFVFHLIFFSPRLPSTGWRSGIFILLCLAGFFAATGIAFVYGYLVPLTGSFVASAGIAMLVSMRNVVWRDKRYRSLRLADSVASSAELLESNQAYEETVALLEHHPEREFAAKRISRLCGSLAQDPNTLPTAVSIMDSLHPELKQHPQLQQLLASYKRDLSRTRTLQAAERKKPVEGEVLPKRLGRYQVERELGRGAVGIVYLGFDPAIARKVAIKTLDSRLFNKDQIQDIKERFFREAEAVGRLNHPNIVSIYDLGEEGELAYIAMDFVDGVALSEHVLPEALLPVSEVYRIIHDVASALAYAHEKHIVHRDIKPGNIMYGADSNAVKVADFGIARLLDNSRTTTGEILGSPLYMSPEQLQGSKVGATADIFSLGVTFYQLLTGELPFDADNLAALTYEMIHTKHKSVRAVRKDLPASAARIVNQCLQKAPKNRYQSAHELVAVMRKAIKRDFPETAQTLSLV